MSRENRVPEAGIYTHLCKMCGCGLAASKDPQFCPNCKSEEIVDYETPGGFGNEPVVGEKIVIARKHPTPFRVVYERTEEGWKRTDQEYGHKSWNDKYKADYTEEPPVIYHVEKDEELPDSIEEFDINHRPWADEEQVKE